MAFDADRGSNPAEQASQLPQRGKCRRLELGSAGIEQIAVAERNRDTLRLVRHKDLAAQIIVFDILGDYAHQRSKLRFLVTEGLFTCRRLCAGWRITGCRAAGGILLLLIHIGFGAVSGFTILPIPRAFGLCSFLTIQQAVSTIQYRISAFEGVR
ncbi:hypothetical protein D3C75_734660 [compost metagenome]